MLSCEYFSDALEESGASISGPSSPRSLGLLDCTVFVRNVSNHLPPDMVKHCRRLDPTWMDLLLCHCSELGNIFSQIWAEPPLPHTHTYTQSSHSSVFRKIHLQNLFNLVRSSKAALNFPNDELGGGILHSCKHNSLSTYCNLQLNIDSPARKNFHFRSTCSSNVMRNLTACQTLHNVEVSYSSTELSKCRVFVFLFPLSS